MYTIQPKKLIIMYILEILREHSDENHTLTQKDIEKHLENDYFMKVDRKTVKRNLADLLDMEIGVSCQEITREGRSGEETICTDWYIQHDFTDAELRLLIDSLLFSKHIPYQQCKELIQKLEGLSSKYFSAKIKHVRNLPEEKPSNPQLFFTIEIMDEAIEHHRQVEFSFGEYGHKKKNVLRKNPDGTPKRYVFNVYQMVATNGRYYAIGNFDYYDNLAYVRLDHISDIKELGSRVKPMKKVKGLERGLNLPKHMAEHIYMMYGETVNAKFKAPKSICDQVVDWFGLDFTVEQDLGDEVIISVKVNERAMRFWAMQYGNYVEVLEPVPLREEIKNSIQAMGEKYGCSSKEDL